MLIVAYTECRLKAFNAECHYAECLNAECRYAECRGALLGTGENGERLSRNILILL